MSPAAFDTALWTLLLYLLLTLIAPPAFYLISVLLAPKRPSRVKKMLFESGQAPIPVREAPFPIEYFPYVIIYIAYAVFAVVAFVVVLDMLRAGESLIRGLIILAALTAGSIYASKQIPTLKQRLERGVAR
ncbi:MAG: NADH-quinone oxidoreductase subunit A [Nitrososphaerota archaeon]|nr:NADH-quinone oxidoreductase subunit A [Candidatus Calditenuaceae archaeon]MDW8073788.1 NADH-quinone oxidoreductase subunit A [Nitrososphaerota archaeon]